MQGESSNDRDERVRRPGEVARFLRQFETESRHTVSNCLLKIGLAQYKKQTNGSASLDGLKEAVDRSAPSAPLSRQRAQHTDPALKPVERHSSQPRAKHSGSYEPSHYPPGITFFANLSGVRTSQVAARNKGRSSRRDYIHQQPFFFPVNDAPRNLSQKKKVDERGIFVGGEKISKVLPTRQDVHIDVRDQGWTLGQPKPFVFSSAAAAGKLRASSAQNRRKQPVEEIVSERINLHRFLAEQRDFLRKHPDQASADVVLTSALRREAERQQPAFGEEKEKVRQIVRRKIAEKSSKPLENIQATELPIVAPNVAEKREAIPEDPNPSSSLGDVSLNSSFPVLGASQGARSSAVFPSGSSALDQVFQSADLMDTFVPPIEENVPHEAQENLENLNRTRKPVTALLEHDEVIKSPRRGESLKGEDEQQRKTSREGLVEDFFPQRWMKALQSLIERTSGIRMTKAELKQKLRVEHEDNVVNALVENEKFPGLYTSLLVHFHLRAKFT